MNLKQKLISQALSLAGIYHRPCDRILSAQSTDGKTWKRDRGVRIDVEVSHGAHMVYHCWVLPLEKGTYRMYFHGSTQNGKAWTGSIYSAHSIDGLAWDHEDGCRIKGGVTPDMRHARSPSVLRLEDGRLRMYYARIGDNGVGAIFSAISLNGLDWTDEDDARLCREAMRGVDTIHDCSAVVFEDGVRLYFSVTEKGTTHIRSAFSSDGINFLMDEGIRIESGVPGRMVAANNPHVVAMPNGLTMFFRGADRLALDNTLYSANSQDGLHWETSSMVLSPRMDRFERHGLGFPHMAHMHDGSFRLYYTAYWGRHLNEDQTVSQWEQANKKLMLDRSEPAGKHLFGDEL